jgi:hypothetical protein
MKTHVVASFDTKLISNRTSPCWVETYRPHRTAQKDIDRLDSELTIRRLMVGEVGVLLKFELLVRFHDVPLRDSVTTLLLMASPAQYVR